MELANLVQILDKANCISLGANTVRKGMNPSDLPVNRRADWALGTLVRQPVKKKNCYFKPTLLCLKISLISHTTHGEGVGQIHICMIYIK